MNPVIPFYMFFENKYLFYSAMNTKRLKSIRILKCTYIWKIKRNDENT